MKITSSIVIISNVEREEAIFAAREIQRPEILRRHYPVLVIDPYSINIKDTGPNFGKTRLSFYSAFVIHVAREMIEDGLVDHVILFDDASFGPGYDSTGDLMFDYLTRDREGGPILTPDRITPYEGRDMARTPTQVGKVATYLREKGLQGSEALYLGWDYHRERVFEHAQGFGLNLKYASAEQIHRFYEPKFDLEKLMEVLPLEEIEQMEAGSRLGKRFSKRGISHWDKKGIIPAIFQSLPVLGGPRMLDNRRENGKLRFDYRRGKDRRKELGLA